MRSYEEFDQLCPPLPNLSETSLSDAIGRLKLRESINTLSISQLREQLYESQILLDDCRKIIESIFKKSEESE